MSTRLSKSRFQKGLQCEKALWLSVHAPELASTVTESKQWIFDQGGEVGRLAHGLFPDGTEVTDDYRHSAEALEATTRYLAEGASILYEPALYFDGVLVRVDILVRVDDGLWDLYEVKSSGSLKPEHITDAAVQTYVVEGSGLAIRRAHVVHLNTSYVYTGGDYDLAELFVIEDVTAQARDFIASVPATLTKFRSMLDGPEPAMRIGIRCRRPYECDYAAHCHAFLPEQHPVTDLPYLSERALHQLLDSGIDCIADIPIGFPGLSEGQASTAHCVRTGRAWADREGLAAALDTLAWPVYHLDFETINPALPLWPHTSPYEQVPFQYSIHVHHEDGTYEHREYLHPGPDDPRHALVNALLKDLGESGSVTHYTSYERRMLNGLARAVPARANEIQAVIRRLLDLEPIIKYNTLHPDAAGRTSIKYVLPAWCPDMSYSGLGIGDGQTASVRYLHAITGRITPAEAETVFADLREYCGMDTYAMVRLLERLRELVG